VNAMTKPKIATFIPLKITGERFDSGGGIHRYDFIVNPLVANSPVFRVMRYCLSTDLLDDECRKILARDLWKKHGETWQRYHAWRESKNT